MDVNDLIEIEAIKRVKYRYIRCLDQKLWDEMATCFTDDAIAAYSGGKYRYEGRDAILEFLDALDGSRHLPLEPSRAPARDRPHGARHGRRAPGPWTTWS